MSTETRVKKLIQSPTFWQEVTTWMMQGNSWKFSPYGAATVCVPEFFRECIRRASKEMQVCDFQYTESVGCLELRQTIAKYFAPFANFKNCDGLKNVALGVGALGVIEHLVKLMMRAAEDEIITFEPIYPYHYIGLRQRGVAKVAKMIYCKERNRWEFDYEDFKSKLSAKTKLVILCNPNNPTGRIFDPEEYQKLTEILDAFPHIRVVEDCAYSVYVNGTKPVRYFHEFGNNIEKTFTVFSAGKIFNTTGNRIGWLLANERLTQEYILFANNFFYPSAMEQQIYKLAIEESFKPYRHENKEYKNFWEFHSFDNAERYHYLRAGLDKLGLKSSISDGSYYILVNIEPLMKNIEPEYFQTYEEHSNFDPARDCAVTRKLMFKYQVGVFPISPITLTETTCDSWIRVACNRSYEDLDLLLKTLKEIAQGK